MCVGRILNEEANQFTNKIQFVCFDFLFVEAFFEQGSQNDLITKKWTKWVTNMTNSQLDDVG